MRRGLGLLGLAWLGVLVTCVGTPTEPLGSTGEVEVAVAALDLQGVGDVVWDLEVVNGADPAQVVWHRRLASSHYGDGAGSASVVGPCDADSGARLNTVKVWVVGVYSAAVDDPGAFASGAATGVGAVDGDPLSFQNPTADGPLTREVDCEENADAAVSFDVALMRPAQQGFFDIAVNFNNIFCSAKFDCCDEPAEATCALDGSEDIALLFDAGGTRASTMVLGFACTAGPGDDVETQLYLDALQLDCTSPSAETFSADILVNPAGTAGNQCAAGALSDCTGVVTENGLPPVDADLYLYQVAVYRGLEELESDGVSAQKVYWNVALGVKRPAIAQCWLKTRGTADDVLGTSAIDQGAIAAGVVYPYIQWEVPLGACGAEPLTFDDADAKVRPVYTTPQGTGLGFAYGYGPRMPAGSFCSPPCENGGQCSGGVCDCPDTFTGLTCADAAPGCGSSPDPCPDGEFCTLAGACVPNGTTPNATPVGFAPSLLYLPTGGTTTVAAVDGNGPYRYSLLSGGGSLVGDVYTAPGAPGVATVRVTDAFGGTADLTLSTYGPLTLSPTDGAVATGETLAFVASGGVGPYAYAVVSGGGTFSGATYAAPGVAGPVTVRVTDGLGHTADVTVTVFAPLTLAPASVTLLTETSQTFTATGGVGAYTYAVLSGGGTFSDATYTAPATPGTATVRVTDELGHTADASVTVLAPLAISPAAVVLESGETQGFSATGGAGSYTFTLESGVGTLAGTTYTASGGEGVAVVRVTDGLGNTADASITVAPPLNILPAVLSLAPGETVTVTGTGGAGGYSYALLSGGGTLAGAVVTAPAFGEVVVQVTDAVGDTATATLKVRSYPRLSAFGIVAYGDVATSQSACAVRADTGLYCWGENAKGQVGDGTLVDVEEPIQIGAATGWVNVDVGSGFTCAVRNDGTAWCWGKNNYRQLGDGTSVDSTVPVQVGTDTDWTEISAGSTVACGLKRDGTLWCWGGDTSGALGLGTTTSVTGPTQVGTDTTWRAIAAGVSTCALKADHTLWCWGSNSTWQLGIGAVTAAQTSPVQVGATGAGWASVTDPLWHTCGTRLDGTLWCWGTNTYGQLGVGGTAVRQVPAQVAAGVTTWASVDTGGGAYEATTCATRTDGTLWCWGSNRWGQLGDGQATALSTVAADLPSQVGTLTSWSAVGIGAEHACAVQNDASLWCWGRDEQGALGSGGPTRKLSPWPLPGTWSEVDLSVVYQTHGCGLDTDGGLSCWGSNDYGQLGRGGLNAMISVPPGPVAAGPASWTALAGGGNHRCALASGGVLWCWGRNNSGQLGDGSTADRATPDALAGTWSQVAAAASSTCGIQTDGTLWCWGANGSDQLGLGSTAASTITSPTQVGTLTTWSHVQTEQQRTCALRTDGTMWCWGYNGSFGAPFGNNTTTSSDVPVAAGTGHTWASFDLGYLHACGIDTAGALWCWGYNADGELGLGTTATPQMTAQRVGTATDWTVVNAGAYSTCGIRAGELWCWGGNSWGAVGDGTQTNALSPTRIGTASNWVDVRVGGAGACARDANGLVACWGDDSAGQLTGYGVRRGFPTEVLWP